MWFLRDLMKWEVLHAIYFLSFGLQIKLIWILRISKLHTVLYTVSVYYVFNSGSFYTLDIKKVIWRTGRADLETWGGKVAFPWNFHFSWKVLTTCGGVWLGPTYIPCKYMLCLWCVTCYKPPNATVQLWLTKTGSIQQTKNVEVWKWVAMADLGMVLTSTVCCFYSSFVWARCPLIH